MQAFDFDNTIYKGESSYDFAIFVMKHNPKLFKYLPGILRILLLYKVKRMDAQEFLTMVNNYNKPFFENKDEIIRLTKKFWETHEKNLYLNMLEKIHFNDVIITAAPDFLINGIKDRLNTKHILCTKTDLKKGTIEYLNFGSNKVKLFKEKYPHKTIKNFYTDSYNDTPFMNFSLNVYLVSHGDSKKIK